MVRVAIAGSFRHSRGHRSNAYFYDTVWHSEFDNMHPSRTYVGLVATPRLVTMLPGFGCTSPAN